MAPCSPLNPVAGEAEMTFQISEQHLNLFAFSADEIELFHAGNIMCVLLGLHPYTL